MRRVVASCVLSSRGVQNQNKSFINCQIDKKKKPLKLKTAKTKNLKNNIFLQFSSIFGSCYKKSNQTKQTTYYNAIGFYCNN